MKISERFEKFANGKGYYVALSVCIVAIAASVIGLRYTTRMITDFTQATGNATLTELTTLQMSEDAGREQTGVPDERTSVTDTSESQVSETNNSTVTQESLPSSETSVSETETHTEHTAKYTLPLGTEIIKDYSNGELAYSATMSDWRLHNGVDFAGSQGANVCAIADGTVTALTSSELFGTVLEIDHGNGVTARYCGLESGTTVIIGALVKAGETIGCLGSIPCETVEGFHLHFETKVNGEYVDPLEVLGKAGS